jgi:hypothetical protein
MGASPSRAGRSLAARPAASSHAPGDRSTWAYSPTSAAVLSGTGSPSLPGRPSRPTDRTEGPPQPPDGPDGGPAEPGPPVRSLRKPGQPAWPASSSVGRRVVASRPYAACGLQRLANPQHPRLCEREPSPQPDRAHSPAQGHAAGHFPAGPLAGDRAGGVPTRGRYSAGHALTHSPDLRGASAPGHRVATRECFGEA